MIARFVAAVLVLALAGACLVFGWPQLFGLEQTTGVAWVVALRGLCAAIALAGVVLFTLIALVARATRRFAAAVAIVLLAFVGLQTVVLGSRGLIGTGMGAAEDTTVTVLAWNTLGDEVPAEEIATLVRQTEADVVALPETTWDRGAEVVALLEAETGDGPGWQLFTFAYDQILKARSTTMLVSDRLGEYRAETDRPTTPELPSLLAVPVNGEGPTLVAVHPIAPVQIADWRDGLEWIAEVCAADRGSVIVAGDFNSTIDHWTRLADPSVPNARLGACLDAAEAGGQGGQGTWPTELPALLGAPIDHVLHTADWHTTGFRVIGSRDHAGSDHRPVLARLTPAE